MRPLLARIPVAKLAVNLATLATPALVASWLPLIAATTAPACAVEIFNGTGKILKLSTGAPGFEDASELLYYVLPGGSGILLPLVIPRGVQLSVRAVDNDTTDGYIILNFFG